MTTHETLELEELDARLRALPRRSGWAGLAKLSNWGIDLSLYLAGIAKQGQLLARRRVSRRS